MATTKKPNAGVDTTKAKRIPVADIPEVQEFLDIKQELDGLRANNPDVFMLYNDLVDRYNTKLEEADSKVRTLGVSCGPFENFSVSHVYSADKMLDELGEKTFLECGGRIGQKATYDVDTATVTAAIASGKIPADAVENFLTVKRSYKSPKKIQG